MLINLCQIWALEPKSVNPFRSIKEEERNRERGREAGTEEAGCRFISLFHDYIREADFLFKVQRKWSVLFSYFHFSLGEKNPALKPLCLNSLGKPSMREAFMKS